MAKILTEFEKVKPEAPKSKIDFKRIVGKTSVGEENPHIVKEKSDRLNPIGGKNTRIVS